MVLPCSQFNGSLYWMDLLLSKSRIFIIVKVSKENEQMWQHNVNCTLWVLNYTHLVQVRIEAALSLRTLTEIDPNCVGGLFSYGVTMLTALRENVSFDKVLLFLFAYSHLFFSAFFEQKTRTFIDIMKSKESYK